MIALLIIMFIVLIGLGIGATDPNLPRGHRTGYWFLIGVEYVIVAVLTWSA
jgi:hypothetical protein